MAALARFVIKGRRDEVEPKESGRVVCAVGCRCTEATYFGKDELSTMRVGPHLRTRLKIGQRRGRVLPARASSGCLLALPR